MIAQVLDKNLRLGVKTQVITSGIVNALTNAQLSLFDCPKYSDLTIRCEDDRFMVHKAIVCAQSKFFAAACDSNMMEKETNTIVIKEDNIDVVRAMLHFLYKFDYDDGNKFADSMEPTSFNILVYAIGDKYDIQELKALAKNKFERLVKESWMEDTFPEALRAVYETTPATDRGLRDIAAKIVHENLMEFMKGSAGFKIVLGEVAALGADVVIRLTTIRDDRSGCCHSCGTYFD